MNLGIQYSSRPRNREENNNGYRSGNQKNNLSKLSTLAKKMGVEISEFGEEAERMWSTLNELHDSDPAAYESFIRDQLAEGARSAYSESSQAQESASIVERSFVPKKGFVVKTWKKQSSANATGGNSKKKNHKAASSPGTEKVFVNFCQHEAVQKPMNTISGNSVEDDMPPHCENSNIEIPLLVSVPRRCQSPDDDSSDKVSATAVDIIFHPWCFNRAEKNGLFKAQLVKLGFQWVQQECGISLDERRWKILIKCSYKGGIVSGTNKKKGLSNVHPFPVCEDMLTTCSGDKEGKNLKSKDGIISSRTSETAQNSEPRSPSKIMDSPAELLRSLKSTDYSDSDSTEKDSLKIVMSTKPNVQSTLNRPLIIEEISSTSGCSAADGKDKYDTFKKKEHPRGSPVPLKKQMRGFLSTKGKKYKPLYEEGSSGDGMNGTGGTYARFMSRCQVVDTSKMTLSSEAVAQTDDKQKVKRARKAEKPFQNFSNKGFLDNKKGLALKRTDSNSSGFFDAEFHDLVEKLDPNFASNFVDPRKRREEDDRTCHDITQTLSALSRIIDRVTGSANPGNEGQILEQVSDDGTSKKWETKPEIEEEGKSAPPSNKTVKEGEPVQKRMDLPFTTLIKDGKQILEVDLSSCQPEIMNLQFLDLEVSATLVSLKTICGKKMAFRFGHKINLDRVSAKYHKERQKLKISMPLLTE